MPYIEWSKDLETGIPVVDADHRVLVELLNQVHDAIGDSEEHVTLGSVLRALGDYTVYHFAREERLQEVAGFEGVDAHRRTHAQLAARVTEIARQYATAPDTVQASEVNAFLRSWLIDHILKQDMAFVDACRGNRAAVAAAEAMRFGEIDPLDDRDAAAGGPEAAAVPVDWPALAVLVVEDNQNFQMIIGTILKSLGVRALTFAGSGSEGLDRLADGRFDLVLCDWRMEGMDGLAFVSHARHVGSPAAIIMMSGYSDAALRDEALAAGVDAFLEKPITARGFLETAGRVLGGAAT